MLLFSLTINACSSAAQIPADHSAAAQEKLGAADPAPPATDASILDLDVSTLETAHSSYEDEPQPYDKTRDARADVDETLFAAKSADKHAIIVMGANWCHDSRALAGHFLTPRFQTLFEGHYEVVYVDMGIKDRNLDIAADFGIDKVEGTPTVIVVNAGGDVINLDTAKTWRNAADREEDAIYNEFASFVGLEVKAPVPAAVSAAAPQDTLLSDKASAIAQKALIQPELTIKPTKPIEALKDTVKGEAKDAVKDAITEAVKDAGK